MQSEVECGQNILGTQNFPRGANRILREWLQVSRLNFELGSVNLFWASDADATARRPSSS